ncbi:hypothetical protein DFH07DRAFT_770005 [Mycena maculata]|uniref:Uncharacterized protein n=1 Tax=Mycena maculata TaxID=230809 RepID=A0AAD7JKJ3_9AGAR|nr:hypothetical protein DFH07DRAFT_770005 [Mycena maculata]
MALNNADWDVWIITRLTRVIAETSQIGSLPGEGWQDILVLYESGRGPVAYDGRRRWMMDKWLVNLEHISCTSKQGEHRKASRVGGRRRKYFPSCHHETDTLMPLIAGPSQKGRRDLPEPAKRQGVLGECTTSDGHRGRPTGNSLGSAENWERRTEEAANKSNSVTEQWMGKEEKKLEVRDKCGAMSSMRENSKREAASATPFSFVGIQWDSKVKLRRQAQPRKC